MSIKKKNITGLFKKLAAKTGGEVMGELETVKYFIDTGNLATNYICSGKFIHGGVPGGRITEIYGPSSAGKSYFGANIMFGCQKLGGIPAILDCENASNAEFIERTSHLDLNCALRYEPFTLEAAFLKIYNLINQIRVVEKIDLEVPVVIIYDSISISPCERELRETNLPENYKPSDWKTIVGRKEQPGERAKICSREFRKMSPILAKNNITVGILNQIRQKIGMFVGNPETTGGGGLALEFSASCRLRLQAKKKIENKRLETFAGVNIQMKNVKNRTFRPFVESEGIQLFFDSGLNPVAGLLSILRESERIVLGKGSYSVAPAYLPDGQTDYKFKASKARNIIPVQVLLDCPALIDAKDTQEVQDYLAPFSVSIASSQSPDFGEKKLAFDSEGNPIEVEGDEDENEASEE